MNEDKQLSYTAASTFPVKLLLNDKLRQSIKKTGKIIPIHFQINPTNLCPLDCPFCSCANRKKDEKLDWKKLKVFMQTIKNLGCQGITITGGGEPLFYPEINKLIDFSHELKIKVGLVTNGTAFHKLKTSSMNKITWCRISHSDHRATNGTYLDYIRNHIRRGKKADWAFSYVLTANPDYDKLASIVQCANEMKMTHVRIVSDLLNLENVPSMEKVKMELKGRKVDDNLVIYQGRKEFCLGKKRCLISLLKPVLTPQGTIVACCGWQYRKREPSRNYDDGFENMGNMEDIEKIIDKQKYFDGRRCYRCYYDDYNITLDLISIKVDHKEFV